MMDSEGGGEGRSEWRGANCTFPRQELALCRRHSHRAGEFKS